MSRIDYFLISVANSSLVTNCEIIPGFLSDHSFVQLKIDVIQMIRGRGFWKFNNSLLYDKHYLDLINKEIRDFLTDDTNTGLNPAQSWEHLKFLIQTKSIRYAKDKQQERTKELDRINHKIKMMHKKLAMINLASDQAVHHIEKVNTKLDELKLAQEDIIDTKLRVLL